MQAGRSKPCQAGPQPDLRGSVESFRVPIPGGDIRMREAPNALFKMCSETLRSVRLSTQRREQRIFLSISRHGRSGCRAIRASEIVELLRFSRGSMIVVHGSSSSRTEIRRLISGVARLTGCAYAHRMGQSKERGEFPYKSANYPNQPKQP